MHVCQSLKKNQCEPEPRVKVEPIKYAPITPLNLLTFPPVNTVVYTHTPTPGVELLSPTTRQLKCLFLHLSAQLHKQVHLCLKELYSLARRSQRWHFRGKLWIDASGFFTTLILIFTKDTCDNMAGCWMRF